MERNLFKYVLRHNRHDQIVILVIVVLSQLFYFLSLDIPKTIVNTAIQGKGFANAGMSVSFFAINLDWPSFLAPLGLSGQAHIFPGISLERVPYLIAITTLFLIMVLINNVFKYQINTQKGRLGERMLRRLRFELLDRILRFPPSHLRKVKQAEMATMIKDEVEPLGGFIGDAFVQPAFLGGQIITALVFILGQSLWLGGIAAFVLLLQVIIITILRRPVLQRSRVRQLTARQLAGRIAECVDGGAEIHVNDTSNYERAEIAERLGEIYQIRFEIYQLKFAIKAFNNLLAQVTPYLFYLIGGYLAITGRFDLGGLLAVINAYKDLPGPVKEMIDWYQQLQDVQIKYEQVVEQFTPEGLLPVEHQAPVDAEPLRGPVAFNNVILFEDGDRKSLDGVSVEFGLDQHLAVIGPGGGGKESMALALARLAVPSSGSLRIGNRNLADLPEAVTGRRIGYVGQDTYLFPQSLRYNVLYGLRHRPERLSAYEGEKRRQHDRAMAEALRAGNPTFDMSADWTDYAAVGAPGPEELDEKIIEILHTVDLEEDVYQFGLRGTIKPDERPDLAGSIIAARRELHDRLQQPDLAPLVEQFDPQHYNRNLSILENLLFGTAVGDTVALKKLKKYVRQMLDRAGLIDDLVAIGIDIARTTIELFADLPPGHVFFEQFGFISSDDMPKYQMLVARADKDGTGKLGKSDRKRFLALAFPYVEARHRLDQIDAAMEERILGARRALAEQLPAELAPTIEFYDPQRYNTATTLQDNILFGRLVYGQAQAAQRIGTLITEVLSYLGLRRAVLVVGLDYAAGVAGNRLTAVQRQKVGLAHGLLKRPDLLVVNAATTVFDATVQARVLGRMLEGRKGEGIVWVLDRDDFLDKFDRVLALRDGKIIEADKSPPAE